MTYREMTWSERVEKVVNRVITAFPPPDDFSNWSFCEELRLSALATCEQIPVFGIESETTARLLNQTAFYLYSKADYAHALPLYQQALACHLKLFGTDHAATATSLNNLALLFDACNASDELGLSSSTNNGIMLR
ncbi:MAG: tetratricopeptide repeat protein [Methylococcales bacterium]|nr:tetratricopeptide repeat protein [Methylococcales bacterium]